LSLRASRQKLFLTESKQIYQKGHRLVSFLFTFEPQNSKGKDEAGKAEQHARF
jgi:hypothetical protein